jgi:hypothetical protein
MDFAYLGGMWTGVAQDEEAIADIYHIDQAVVNNRIAPEHHLV